MSAMSNLALRWRVQSKERKACAAVCLLAALFLTLHGGLTNPHENTTREQRRILALLRGSLRNNMDEFMGQGTGSTFLPDGKVARLKEMDATVYNDHVMSSQPFLLASPLHNCTKSKWTLDVIEKKAGDDIVGIETSRSNRFYSNEGLKKVRMTVREFLRDFRAKSRPYDMYLAEENMKQFPTLEADVKEPSFSEGYNLDKVQLWIGAGGQVSPLHHDQWDNILCQIEGRRTVTLYDPFQTDFLYPKTGVNRHFGQVDPEHPDFAKFPNFRKAKPYQVSLSAGEILFVPAHWWHQVHHEASQNVAVNFWYMPSLLSELIMDIILPEGDNY